MKKTIFLLLFITSTHLFAQRVDSTQVDEFSVLKTVVEKQQDDLKILIENEAKLQKSINQQNEQLKTFKREFQEQAKLIDSLKTKIDLNSEKIQTNSAELGTKIQQADQKAESKISELGNRLSNSVLYWIIIAVIILIIGFIVYWLLKKRIQNSKTDVETQIKDTKIALDEESLRLDNKLIEILESQLKIKQEEKTTGATVSNQAMPDHSLALKVADEIVRMQKNLSRIDENVKGVKPLVKGIERIQNNFAANGYEMVNLLNKPYEERMNLDVINFIEDKTLEQGSKIITKVIKPQVNYNGVLIQRAQVDVSQN